MKIVHHINRDDADDICVEVEVTVGEADEGLTFTAADHGVVVEANGPYKIGDEIELTKPEKNVASDYAAIELGEQRERNKNREYEKEEDFDL